MGAVRGARQRGRSGSSSRGRPRRRRLTPGKRPGEHRGGGGFPPRAQPRPLPTVPPPRFLPAPASRVRTCELTGEGPKRPADDLCLIRLTERSMMMPSGLRGTPRHPGDALPDPGDLVAATGSSVAGARHVNIGTANGTGSAGKWPANRPPIAAARRRGSAGSGKVRSVEFCH